MELLQVYFLTHKSDIDIVAVSRKVNAVLNNNPIVTSQYLGGREGLECTKFISVSKLN